MREELETQCSLTAEVQRTLHQELDTSRSSAPASPMMHSCTCCGAKLLGMLLDDLHTRCMQIAIELS